MLKSLNPALALAALVGMTLPAVAAPVTLSPQQIGATFATGAPFKSASPAGTIFTLVLKAGGIASRTPKGSALGTDGTWRLNATGYCSKWGNNSENCFTVQNNGGKYSVMDAKGGLAAIWTPPTPPK